jgi:hypothetical protein
MASLGDIESHRLHLNIPRWPSALHSLPIWSERCSMNRNTPTALLFTAMHHWSSHVVLYSEKYEAKRNSLRVSVISHTTGSSVMDTNYQRNEDCNRDVLYRGIGKKCSELSRNSRSIYSAAFHNGKYHRSRLWNTTRSSTCVVNFDWYRSCDACLARRKILMETRITYTYRWYNLLLS